MLANSIALVCLLAIVAAKSLEDGPLNIIGGDIEGHVPYMVQVLNKDDTTTCGGAILSATHVLTAWHCVKDESKKNIQVFAGNLNRRGGSYHAVTKSKQVKAYVDLAVLTVDPAFTMDSRRKEIQLPAKDEVPTPGQLVKVSGWGAMEARGIAASMLRTIEVPVMSREQCLNSMSPKERNALSTSEFCIGAPGKSTGTGDSGSPVLSGKKLIGIVSAGLSNPDRYQTFVIQVSKYVDQIKSIIRPRSWRNWFKPASH